MARLHGRHGSIGLSASTSPDGSPADQDFSAVGSLRAWSLSFQRATVEQTSLRSEGRTYLPGMSEVSGSFEGLFDTDQIQTLINAGDDADAVWIRITPSTDYQGLYFQGSAWLNITASGAVGDAVKVAASFTGEGVWQKTFA